MLILPCVLGSGLLLGDLEQQIREHGVGGSFVHMMFFCVSSYMFGILRGGLVGSLCSLLVLHSNGWLGLRERQIKSSIEF